MKPANGQHGNILLRLHPLQRILISLALALVAFVISRRLHLNTLLTINLLWDVFAICFIAISWTVFFTRPVADIRKLANVEDGSKAFVLGSVLVTSVVSMFTVLLLILSKDESPNLVVLSVVLAVIGMLGSWAMVHTIFTFHYAHMYYFEGKDDTPDSEALAFPGTTKPDYLDFAYFSFVIGMTFQVSDVEINSRSVRRTSLAHALLSFVLNTFVVALTINLIAGLK